MRIDPAGWPFVGAGLFFAALVAAGFGVSLACRREMDELAASRHQRNRADQFAFADFAFDQLIDALQSF